MTMAPEHPDQYHWWRDQAACGEAPLILVDEVMRRPGGSDADAFKRAYCSRCPVGAQCLDEAMRNGEHGLWGGTSQHLRTQHGGAHPYFGRQAL